MTSASDLAGRRILLIEDEMLVAMSIEDTLAEAGCHVLGPAATVDKALSMLLENPAPDAVVLDMNLNGKSGMPVADALAGQGVPFLVLSGYGAAALAGTHQGVPVLAKPFGPETLVETLRQLIAGTSAHGPA